ncbi:helix-turn-helix domain-containing protein [Paenibacillus elgii]|nr:AraC family transcriptional regulator [Paenibacillus elgii]
MMEVRTKQETKDRMSYQRTRLKQTIVIDNIITMYYFEFAKNYVFPGEQHDFWELVYVDKGEVEVTAGTTQHRLRQGMVVFHEPDEFHSFYACEGTAPNIIVLTFDCRSEAMKRFARQIVHLEDTERNLLAEIVKEGKHAFEFPFRYPLKRRQDVPAGSEQLIQLYLQTFLIRLLRRLGHAETSKPLSFTAREKDNEALARRVIGYLEDHVEGNVSLGEISEALHVAKTRLKEQFKRQTGLSIMSYYNQLKIGRAKSLIREKTYNFSEIAAMLGFSGPHYFSKAFKKSAGMSPSEYARSVQARSQTDSE